MTLKDKTEVIFYNGLETIGGPMIEVRYGDSHILFDWGEVYRPELKLPDESFKTLLDHELIGDLPDFYDPKLTGKRTSEFKHAAAYISHLHLDHSKALNWLDPEIPLYTSPDTAKLLPVLNKHPFLLPAAGHADDYTRPIIQAELKKPIKIGQITIEIWPSDHDAYGASGLVIQTPDKLIGYTGDIRLHGYHRDWVEAYLQRIKHCDLLITEATGTSWPEQKSEEFSGPKSEQDLVTEIVQLVKDNPHRQLTFNTYPTNVERLIQIAKAVPRKVVLTAKRAAFLKESLDLDYPYYYGHGEQVDPILDPSLAIDYDLLLKDQTKYFFQVDGNWDDLQSGGLYVHSNAEPLGDFDPAFQPFIENLAKRQIELKLLRCSGHADINGLKEIIKTVQPAWLCPVHTLHRELVENPFGKRILPKRNQVFAFV
ncbi:MAG: MBL fold metallo-hydrolase [Lactobacillus sp.]|nr:MBL fold metallo-hydrolase [Lactobacillus sp.]